MSTLATKAQTYGACAFCAGPATGSMKFEGETWAVCDRASCKAEVARLAPVVPAPAPKPFAFKAPNMSPAANLRHQTSVFLGAFRVLTARVEADLDARGEGRDAAERQSMRGVRDSLERACKLAEVVEAARRAAA